MVEDSMQTIITDATECVGRECPPAYRVMQEAIEDRRVVFSVGAERFEWSLVTSDTEGPAREPIYVRTTTRVLRDVLLGEADSLEAIMTDALHVRGTPVDVGALGALGLAFLKGAARSSSMWMLVERLERLASCSGGKNDD